MIQAYSAEGRHYHNLRHVENCLAMLGHVAGLGERDRDTLSEAIWWHDIVYDSTRSDDEELSAVMAEENLAPDLSREVGRLLTRTHHVEPAIVSERS